MNESFLFYRVFSEALKDIPAEEFKNCVIAICDYALDGKEPDGGFAVGSDINLLHDTEIWAEITRRSDEEEAAEEAREKEIWAEVTGKE